MYTQCVVIVYQPMYSPQDISSEHTVCLTTHAVLILFSIVSQKWMVMYAVIVSNLAGVSFIPIATMAEPKVSTYM